MLDEGDGPSASEDSLGFSEDSLSSSQSSFLRYRTPKVLFVHLLHVHPMHVHTVMRSALNSYFYEVIIFLYVLASLCDSNCGNCEEK